MDDHGVLVGGVDVDEVGFAAGVEFGVGVSRGGVGGVGGGRRRLTRRLRVLAAGAGAVLAAGGVVGVGLGLGAAALGRRRRQRRVLVRQTQVDVVHVLFPAKICSTEKNTSMCHSKRVHFDWP